MSLNRAMCLCEVLKLVPAHWRGDFCQFVEEGEASKDFMEFLEQDSDCRRACEMVLRADRLTARLIAAAAKLAPQGSE